MTTKQKQCLMSYLGYYSGVIDGIWGPQSIAATEAFQRRQGLPVSGTFEEATRKKILEIIAGEQESESWWDEIEFFEPGEFACKCGGFCDGAPARMEEKLVRAADRVRGCLGAPATVSSGLRCRQHNANVGGVSNSRHLSGKAMDFCVAGKTAAEVLAVVLQQKDIRYAYAIDARFVHMDVL